MELAIKYSFENQWVCSLVNIDCNHSFIGKQSEPKRRRVNYHKHITGGDSTSKSHDDRQNTNRNATEEKTSVSMIIEENSNISTEMIQLLKINKTI